MFALADRFVEYYGNIESVGKFADRHGDVLFLRSVLCRVLQYDRVIGLSMIDTVVGQIHIVVVSTIAERGEDFALLLADFGVGDIEFAVHSRPGVDVVDAILIGGGVIDGEFDLCETLLLVAEIDVLEFSARCKTIVLVEGKEVNVGLCVQPDGICLTSRVVEFHIHSLGAGCRGHRGTWIRSL